MVCILVQSCFDDSSTFTSKQDFQCFLLGVLMSVCWDWDFFLLTTRSFLSVMICCNHHRLQKTLTFVHLHFSVHLYYQFISHKMQSHAFIWKQHSSISVMCCISAGWPLILYYLSYNIVGLVGLISIDFVGILHELISWQLVKITVWFLGIQRSSWQQHNYNCGK